MNTRDGAATVQRLEHERRMITRLSGIEGVACLLSEREGAVALQDNGGTSLRDAMASGPLPVDDLLELAFQLARTLAEIHGRGVLHLNIQPGSIVLPGSRSAPLLVDFHLATTFAEERPGFTHHRQIRGNLSYLAPELTGRSGRSVDLRADLYALGATLYEAATGRPPFEARDPLELLHDHLARLPAPPRQLRADLPAALSQIILRLLEKEPERRYQGGEGLAHDLQQLQQALARGEDAPMVLGENDFPMQLSAPARLVGRHVEIGSLQHALDEAIGGRGRVVFLSGPPGVGKTSLINELRPMVTQRRGWFVAGKFDQYSRDAPGAPVQAFRALGRLLLAEPESELADQRERLLRKLGTHAGLMCSMPEFALLLGPQPEVPHAEPAQAEGRLLATALEVLRVVVSPERPVVMVLDDLQWAGSLSVRFIQAVADAPGLAGLLLVCSFRDTEVDAAHPLATLLSASNERSEGGRRLVLANLPTEGVAEMLREMMRLPLPKAAVLAAALAEHTGGNPYDTVELLNALRRDGTLARGAGGWNWDAGALRRHVGPKGVLDVLAARVERLPGRCRPLLQALACLGGQVPARLLCAATASTADALEDELAAALDAGLVVIERGDAIAFRLRHDRVQQAIYGSMAPAIRTGMHLALARCLAASGEFGAVAAQQYLPAVDDIDDPDECRRVARLMQQLAVRVRQAADFAAVQRLLSAALKLLARVEDPTPQDMELRARSEIGCHVALCSLGRFEEADGLYRVIEERGAPVEDWVDAACAQVDSLQNRSRPGEAVALGLGLLARLGLDVPDDFGSAELERRLRRMGEWTQGVRLGQDARAHAGDRRSTAAARLISRVGYPAYYSNLKVMGWLMLEAQALWIALGPSQALVHALSQIGGVVVSMNQDYRAAYESSRHVLGVAESRGWEVETFEARFLCATHAAHWVDPLEHAVRQVHLARAGSLHNGDVQTRCFTYRTSAAMMLDCTPTLHEWGEEIESGLKLALRTQNQYVAAALAIERQVLASLRGESADQANIPAEALAAIERQASVPMIGLILDVSRALVAAVFGDAPALARHAAKTMPYASNISIYLSTRARLLQALALAQRARAAEREDRDGLLVELESACRWLAARAVDAPANFLHLSNWIDAERAWTLGDFRGAAGAFDAAVCQAESLTRPWHHALIAERAGLFHLEQGMSQSGRQFIRRARDLYASWGAAAKVARMEQAHHFLRGDPPAPPGASVDSIDALAILRASQALSSETSLARLKARISEVMGALAGATSVQFALWDDERKDWTVSDEQGAESTRMTAQEAGGRGLLPLSALRYAERTREPLVIGDAASDDRFACDPYLAAMGHGSLLLVPILNQGSLRAVLLLENRLGRGAFTAGRLDAVSLIAGQLAVSLENALLYDRLEQRVREQTRELVAAARRTGMAQIATNVLHNVGNVLNSVNTSLHVLRSHVTSSRMDRLNDVTNLLESNAGNLRHFLASTDKGKLLPGYLRELSQALVAEREQLAGELRRLEASVDHIKNVVAMQQSYAGPASSMRELVSLADLVEDALLLQEDALARHGITVARDYGSSEPLPLDRSRLMQILVNLVENAWQAMEGVSGKRLLRVAVRQQQDAATVEVSDNGCGIAQENLCRMFSHGFTTKFGGHGFGLHSCAVAASEMGGALKVHSDGAGAGSTFTLQLPLGPRA
jgi:predicted ATPase/signal transduction histidine kinase